MHSAVFYFFLLRAGLRCHSCASRTRRSANQNSTAGQKTALLAISL